MSNDRTPPGPHAGAAAGSPSVDDVARAAQELLHAQDVSAESLSALARHQPILTVNGLRAGYGRMEILHDFNMRVAAGQSLCFIGPNGAGKSTVLHAIYGFTNIYGGSIALNGRDITHLRPKDKLRLAKVAYITQDNSVFPDMTVEENLWMGGYLLSRDAAHDQAERVLAKYPRLMQRRGERARVLSGGERRLLEISRALIMDPELLLVDEPSIGLEPRYIDQVFEILRDLQHGAAKTIVMVEQNAKKGLEFADVGYVLVSGRLAKAGPGADLLDDPEVGRLFLGG